MVACPASLDPWNLIRVIPAKGGDMGVIAGKTAFVTGASRSVANLGFLLISIRGNPMVDYGSLSADERSVSRCVEEPWALR